MAKKTSKIEEQWPDGVDPTKLKAKPNYRGTRAKGPNKSKGEKGPNLHPYTKLTPAIKADIVSCLSKRFHIGNTCAAIGVSYGSFNNERKKDPEFAAAIMEAKRLYTELIEGTIHCRAIDGWKEPVFGKIDKVYKDEDGNLVKESTTGVVGHVTKYDNKLLLAMAKRFMPDEWNATQKIEQKSEVSGSLAVDSSLTLADLDAETRKALRSFLQKAKRNESGD